MTPYGSDRVRAASGKVFLLSPIPKGWTGRVAKIGTHAEFPGTAVLWDDEYFEVLEASAQPGGGVRYVLAPWREEHTIRVFERYDADSEAAKLADHQAAARQRRYSASSRWLGMLLGHLPQPVQAHLQNELGVRPATMTIASCVPVMVFVGACLYLGVDSMMSGGDSRMPAWLVPLLGMFTLESVVRFYLAMSQNRGMGSVLGTAAYIAFWLVARRHAPVSPFTAKGESTRSAVPPSDEVALLDSLESKDLLLTLLPAAEQNELARRYGYDYRRSARVVACTILFFAVLGAFSAYRRLGDGSAISLLSMLIAGGVAAEQILRLVAMRHGPAGSVFGLLVRPFVKDLLTARY